ncbi:MAG: DnaJ domain-containing protein [Elainellaceae cyanobacterium]
MALKIDRGLFNGEFVDHHAVLGIPINADPKGIRKRYLRIVRRLHPDSGTINTTAERQLANELLSKLVNPAYEKLSQESEYNEYCLLLELKGKEARQREETIILSGDNARQLASSPDLEGTYVSILDSLGNRQYESINDSLGLIGEISELNMVYLMRQQNGGLRREGSKATAATSAPSAASPASSRSTSGGSSRPASMSDLVNAYMRRAEDYATKGNYNQAVLEMREALKLVPQNSHCHARLGMIYLDNNQPTMAKVHFRKSLQLNPKETIAKEGLRRVDPAGSKSNTAKANQPGKARKSDKGSNGFLGLFGRN